jgi:microcystin degradation protein MlrC
LHMRLFVAALNAETNFWSPIPTGFGAFEFRTPSNPDGGSFQAALEGIYQVAETYGSTIIEGPCGSAQPLGPLTAQAWYQVRTDLIEAVKQALPLDALILLLHGAMSAENCDDCEGVLLEEIRGLVGRDAVIGVELDPHCHFTAQMHRAANVLVAYKEYPHTDIEEQARYVTELTLRAAKGEITPVIATADCPIVGLFPTTSSPMREFVQRMRAEEGQNRVLSVSFGHGFAYADLEEAGAKIWVICDGDMAQATQTAQAFANDIYSMREEIGLRFTSLSDGIKAAREWNGGGAIILADVADNPGGGARADSTFILGAIIEADIRDVAIGGIWDPGAVQICRESGVGAALSLRVGGKSGPAAGDPVDVVGRVMAVHEAHFQTEFGVATPLGPAAWLQTHTGVDIVLLSRCQQVIGMDMFTNLGISLEAKRTIVVKSMQHFSASFAPITGHILYIETPGLLRTDFGSIPFKTRDLNYWPRQPDPLSLGPT